MNCLNCGHCVLNKTNSTDKVCCNTKSENYNKVFTEEELLKNSCEHFETREAIDYKEMNAWQFASKYYM